VMPSLNAPIDPQAFRSGVPVRPTARLQAVQASMLAYPSHLAGSLLAQRGIERMRKPDTGHRRPHPATIFETRAGLAPAYCTGFQDAGQLAPTTRIRDPVGSMQSIN
jgi:hypothetical protein